MKFLFINYFILFSLSSIADCPEVKLAPSTPLSQFALDDCSEQFDLQNMSDINRDALKKFCDCENKNLSKIPEGVNNPEKEDTIEKINMKSVFDSIGQMSWYVRNVMLSLNIEPYKDNEELGQACSFVNVQSEIEKTCIQNKSPFYNEIIDKIKNEISIIAEDIGKQTDQIEKFGKTCLSRNEASYFLSSQDQKTIDYFKFQIKNKIWKIDQLKGINRKKLPELFSRAVEVRPGIYETLTNDKNEKIINQWMNKCNQMRQGVVDLACGKKYSEIPNQPSYIASYALKEVPFTTNSVLKYAPVCKNQNKNPGIEDLTTSSFFSNLPSLNAGLEISKIDELKEDTFQLPAANCYCKILENNSIDDVIAKSGCSNDDKNPTPYNLVQGYSCETPDKEHPENINNCINLYAFQSINKERQKNKQSLLADQKNGNGKDKVAQGSAKNGAEKCSDCSPLMKAFLYGGKPPVAVTPAPASKTDDSSQVAKTAPGLVAGQTNNQSSQQATRDDEQEREVWNKLLERAFEQRNAKLNSNFNAPVAQAPERSLDGGVRTSRDELARELPDDSNDEAPTVKKTKKKVATSNTASDEGNSSESVASPSTPFGTGSSPFTGSNQQSADYRSSTTEPIAQTVQTQSQTAGDAKTAEAPKSTTGLAAKNPDGSIKTPTPATGVNGQGASSNSKDSAPSLTINRSGSDNSTSASRGPAGNKETEVVLDEKALDKEFVVQPDKLKPEEVKALRTLLSSGEPFNIRLNKHDNFKVRVITGPNNEISLIAPTQMESNTEYQKFVANMKEFIIRQSDGGAYKKLKLMFTTMN